MLSFMGHGHLGHLGKLARSTFACQKRISENPNCTHLVTESLADLLAKLLTQSKQTQTQWSPV